MRRWLYPVFVGVIVWICIGIGCDRHSSDDDGVEVELESGNDGASVEVSERYAPFAGMKVRQSGDRYGRGGTTCSIRGDQAFAGCEECSVACVQRESGKIPEGRFVEDGSAGDVVIEATSRGIMVDQTVIVDVRGGEVDPAHLGGHGSLRIEPVHREMASIVEDLRERAASVGEETGDMEGVLHIEPAHPARLLWQLGYTAVEADLRIQLATMGGDATEFSLACRRGESNRDLFEADERGEARRLDSPGSEKMVNWLCRDASGSPSGDEWKQTTIAVGTPRVIPIADPMDEELDLAPLSISIHADGVSVAVAELSSGGNIGAFGPDDIFPPIEGCPADGPTVCLADEEDGDALELFAAAREAMEDGEAGMDNPPLGEVIARYDFEALSRIVAEWQDDTEGPGDIVTVSAYDGVPTALVVETIKMLRGEGQWEGERTFFEHVALAVGDIDATGGVDDEAIGVHEALSEDAVGEEALDDLFEEEGRPAALVGDVPEEVDSGGMGLRGAGDGPSAVAPSVALESLDIDCDRDGEAMRDVTEARSNAIQHCYERELQSEPELGGEVTFSGSVGREGVITDIDVVASTLEKPSIEGCVVRTIQRMRFGDADEDCDVEFDFSFHPEVDK